MPLQIASRLLLLLTILFLGRSLHSTTFVDRPMSDVVAESEFIVRGRTGASYTDYDPSGSGRIVTYTPLKIDETLKGRIQTNEILIRQPGGAKDGLELRIPGTAEFQTGEDVVVLLDSQDTRDQSFPMPGLASAKYVVERRNGEEVLINSLGSDEIYNRSENPKELSYNSRVSLEQFKTIVAKTTDQEKALISVAPPEPPAPSAMPIDDITHQDSSVTTHHEDTPVKRSWRAAAVVVFFIFTGVWYLRRRRKHR